MTRRTARGRLTAACPLSAIETTKSETLSLSDAVMAWLGDPRVRGQQRRAVGGGRERLAARRVVDDADRRPAIDDEPDRHAEERDAVGVVHRAVERVDDPHPAASRGRRLARHRPMLAALLGQDRVAGMALRGWRR